LQKFYFLFPLSFVGVLQFFTSKDKSPAKSS
jgi:hypothetical protein